MIRIDFTINRESGIVNTTWISEVGDTHSLIGRQTMLLEEWTLVRNALSRGDEWINGRFFKFEEKKTV